MREKASRHYQTVDTDQAENGSSVSVINSDPQQLPLWQTGALPIQANLRIGTPDDPLEQEADRIADRVMRTASGGVSRVSSGDVPQSNAPPSVHRTVQQPGTPIDAPTRHFMEARFGRDLSAVRVHTDTKAAQSAQDVNARAYTVGQNVVFAPGQYDPGSDQGRHLLAHELAHTLQQDSAPLSVQRDPDDSTASTTRAPVAESDALAGTPEAIPEDAPGLELVDYAFFYAGGGYGTSAREFFETFYPDHIRVEGSSFEQMFDRLYRDLVRYEREGRRVQVSEIVIVTHANSAGGLQIPLARDDVRRERNFTPWDLAALQEEFRDRTHEAFQRRQEFREHRQAVVSRFLRPNASIVVRGCQFGQSQDGLDALRSFFGGSVYVWAPRGYQGYQVAGIGSTHLQSAEEAFDMLQSQGMIPQDLDLSPEEKRLYLQRELGITGAVPSEFFVMGQEDYAALKGLIGEHRGMSEEAESRVTRSDVDIPSSGEAWGLSAPSALGEDPDLDSLSIDEIERRARILNSNYQPAYAPMLLRLRDAWERKGLEVLDRCEDRNDPLCGLPPSEIFGSPNGVASDAARFRWSPTYFDSFEDVDLPFAPPAEGAAAANEYDEGLGAVDEEALAAQQAAQSGGGGAGRAPTGGGGGTERQQATPEQLAAARDFSKDVPPPVEPEEPPELTLEELLAALGTDAGILAVLATLPEEGWQLSDYLSAAELTVSGVTAVPTIFAMETFLGLSAFTWEAIGLLAPIISIAGFFVSLGEASEAQEMAAHVLGIRLGLDQMLFDAARERDHDVERWMEAERNSRVMFYQVAYGYPLSPERVRGNVRIGMQEVAEGANDVTQAAVRRVRAHLRERGMPESRIEETIDQLRPRIRRIILTALYQRGQRALQERREALEERERD